MTSDAVAIGAVVRDTLGREGIVLSKDDPPSQEWIDELIDADDVKKLGRVQWWGVMPFEGGYLLCPEPMLTWLRAATYEDFLQAVEHAAIPGRFKLAKALPHFVDRVVESRRAGRD